MILIDDMDKREVTEIINNAHYNQRVSLCKSTDFIKRNVDVIEIIDINGSRCEQLADVYSFLRN